MPRSRAYPTTTSPNTVRLVSVSKPTDRTSTHSPGMQGLSVGSARASPGQNCIGWPGAANTLPDASTVSPSLTSNALAAWLAGADEVGSRPWLAGAGGGDSRRVTT